MQDLWGKFASDECGATAIEYGLIATFIAVVIVGALSAIATALNGTFGNVVAPL